MVLLERSTILPSLFETRALLHQKRRHPGMVVFIYGTCGLLAHSSCEKRRRRFSGSVTIPANCSLVLKNSCCGLQRSNPKYFEQWSSKPLVASAPKRFQYDLTVRKMCKLPLMSTNLFRGPQFQCLYGNVQRVVVS